MSDGGRPSPAGKRSETPHPNRGRRQTMTLPIELIDTPFARLGDRMGNPLRLLMVHAHPDQQTPPTGATAPLYAAESIDVHLVTCTRGERGEILDPEVQRAVDAAVDR